jgi:site-specific DNA-methyltransferase (adenine-specific)
MLNKKHTELLAGDCLEILRGMPDGQVHLAYLDPPFFTQKMHKLRNRQRTKQFSFDDRWSSHSDYTDFIHERLLEVDRVLSLKGSIFVHCDRSANHIIRSLLDRVFGEENFRSEIVWTYRRWSNSKRRLLPGHQNIYYYTKTDEYVFNELLQDYSPSTNVDQILQRRVRDEYGKAIYQKDSDGRVVSNGGKKGVPLSDVWDIPYLNPKAKERTGYPTQKPILLLERIISLASNEGDLVLDPFCGSGTTLVAAQFLGRRAIGIDIAEEAVSLARERCDKPLRTESALLVKGRESYQQADTDALKLLEGLRLAPVQRNKGIDAILSEDVDGRPVLIRIQRRDETLSDTINKLKKAARRKRPGALIVIATQEGGGLFDEELLDHIHVVNVPSLQIKKIIKKKNIK